MKKILLLLCFLPMCVVAQVDLNLQMCRNMAIQSSKTLDIAIREQEKSVYESRIYRADFFPRISITGVGFYNQKKYHYKLKGGYLPSFKPGTDGKLQPDVLLNPETHKPILGADGKPIFNSYAFMPDMDLQLGMRGVYHTGIQLEQPIYMGGKVRTAHAMAKIGENIAAQNVRMSKSDVLLEADCAYWQLMRLEEQVIAVRKYKETLASLVRNLQDSEKVGMITSNDVLKAQVRYNEADLLLQKVEHGRVLAQMNLCRLIGLDLETELHLQDSLTAEVSSAVWSLDSAISQRPDYNILLFEFNMKEKKVALSRSDFLPQLGITAGYGYGGGVKLNGRDAAGAGFSALAAVKIPVFHWGEGRNKIRSARMDEEISRLNLEKYADLMHLEISSDKYALQDSQTRVRLAKSALVQAEENLKMSTDQYQVGMETLTSLLEAQAQWQEAWSQWIDAKAELHLYESTYLKSIGKLE